MRKTIEQAAKLGAEAKKKGLMRVSPFYEERDFRDGNRVDVTAELSQAFMEGYDLCPDSSKTS